MFADFQKISTFAPEFFAQVAELVDALDSKSSILNRCAGSIPALSTKTEKIKNFLRFLFFRIHIFLKIGTQHLPHINCRF